MSPSETQILQDWQIWLALTAGSILLFVGLSYLCIWFFTRTINTANHWQTALLNSIRLPLILLFLLLGITIIPQLYLPPELSSEAQSTLALLLKKTRNIGIILCFIFFIWRLLSVGERTLLSLYEKGEITIDKVTIIALSKSGKIAVAVLTLLMLLHTAGVSIAGILAFGGVGGVVVGFAAKDLLANLFGGFMIFIDRPFTEGDWIRSPDRDIEGVVQNIGWRQTCIKHFARYPIYLPNAVFSTIAIENMSRMECRRIFEAIGVRYDDMEKITGIVSDIKNMLLDHPEIDSDQTTIVNLNEFQASSVDIMIYTYTHTAEWVKFHAIKQEILLNIAKIIQQHGASTAFPTTTLDLPPTVGIPEPKAAPAT